MYGLGRFVSCQLIAHMVLDSLLVERDAVVEVDDCRDGLAPFFIRYTYDQRFTDGGMGLEHFLDFFWVYLLASSVDAYAAAA